VNFVRFVAISVWEESFEMPVRVDTSHLRKPCIFYSMILRACTIFDVRPSICNTYLCYHLEEVESKLVQGNHQEGESIQRLEAVPEDKDISWYLYVVGFLSLVAIGMALEFWWTPS